MNRVVERLVGWVMRLVAAAGAMAGPVPESLQGRWAAQAGQCDVPGEGLTLTADGLLFVTGSDVLVAGVAASEAGEFRARLTITSVQGGAGPQVGDSLVLERMGEMLQGIETVQGGVARDVSGGAPMTRCE